MPWTYRYSVDEQCGPVKQEPEDCDAGAEAEASWASLYADHSVKEELVFGPEQFQPQDIAVSMQHALIKTEEPYSWEVPCSLEEPCSPKPTDEARTEPASSPILSGEPQIDKTLQQLAYCFVRLERIVLDEQHSSSFRSPDKPVTCNSSDRELALKHNLDRHVVAHRNLFCHICQKNSPNYPVFTEHMEQHKLKPYHCNVCHKLFAQPSTFVNHKLVHTRDPLFCNDCQKQFENIENWQHHRETKHSQNPEDSMEQTSLDRDLCDKTLISDKALHVHKQEYQKSQARKHFCTICDRTFKHIVYLTSHMLVHLKPHRCATCPESFAHSRTLASHIQVKHLGVNPFLCKICQEQFSTSHERNVHMKEEHFKKEKPISCNICQERFVNMRGKLSHMRKHIINHMSNPEDLILSDTYSCDICHQENSNQQDLLTHMQTQHSTELESNTKLLAYSKLVQRKLHCCQICRETCWSRADLLTHIRIQHLKEKPHCCEICQKQFMYTKLLNAHMAKEHNVNPQKKTHCCDICQKRFLYKNNLETHMKNHAISEPNRKPYCCNICGLEFVYSVAWYSHIRTHQSNERAAHLCIICQTRFKTKNSLRVHMRKHHQPSNEQHVDEEDIIKTKPHCCDICQIRFKLKQVLLNHIEKQHPKPVVFDYAKMRTRHSKPTHKPEAIESNKPTVKEKPLGCKICTMKFVYRKALLNHMRARHPKSSESNNMESGHQKANESNEQIIPPSTITDHKKDLTQDKSHSCNIIRKRFVHKKIKSTITHHKKYSTLEKLECCEFCHQRFVYRKSLVNHLQMRHPEKNHKKEQTQDELHCCKICRIRFVHKNDFLNHLKNQHQRRIKINKHSTKTHESNESNIMESGHQKENESNEQIIPPSTKTDHEKDLTPVKLECCEFCQKRFAYRKSLLTHLQTRHPKQNESNNMQSGHWKANESNKQIIPPSTKTDHEKDLTPVKLECCEFCQKRFAYRKSLLTHLQTRHPKQNESNNMQSGHWKANESNKQIIPPSTKTDYEKDLTPEKRECCEFCQKRFVFRKSLLTHLQTRHPKQNESNMMQSGHQKANESNEQIIPPSTKTDHKKDLTPEKLECCEFCQKRFVFRKSLLNHLQARHPKQNHKKEQTQDKLHCCNICRKRFVHRKVLLNHMEKRHKRKIKINKHRTKTHESNESNIMESGHQKENESNEQIIPPSTITDHKKDLTPVKLECCEFCQKRFVYRKSLLTHLQTQHPKQNECNNMQSGHQKANESKERMIPPSTITDHKKDLTPEKRECCEFCQKRFVFRKSLLTHLKTRHPKQNQKKEQTQDKLHCCNICRKRFVYRKVLLNHMEKRHKRKIKIHKHSTKTHESNESNIMESGHQIENESNEQIIPPSTKTDHKKDLTAVKLECCEFCQKRFVYRKSLLTHLQTRHLKQNESNMMQSGHQKANESNEQIIPPSTKTDHKKDLTPEKLECCEFCQKRFVFRKSLLNHLQARHPKQNYKKEQTQDKLHCCNICRKRFVHRKVLLNHMEKRHKRKIKINKHRTKTHESNESNIMESGHQKENESNEQIIPPSTITDHKKDLTPVKLECCEFCQKRFVYRKSLLTHLQTQHPKQNECNNMQSGHQKANESKERMIPPSTITDHKKDLTPEKRECCEFCQKRFVFRKSLLTHLKTRHPKQNHKKEQTQDKLHCCKICRKRFVYRKVLLNHMEKRHKRKIKIQKHSTKTHESNESNIMESGHQIENESNEQIIPPSTITDHKKDLTLEKLECCEFCQKRFVYRKSLLNHLQTRHPKQNHKKESTHGKSHCCEICQIKFIYRKSLLNHMQKRHSKPNDNNLQNKSNNMTTNGSNEQLTPPASLTNQNREKPNVCEFCPKTFVLRKVLHRHMVKRHRRKMKSNKPNPRQIVHCCEICQKYFALKKLFLAHMQQHTEYESNINVSPPFSLKENKKLSGDEDNNHISPPLGFEENDAKLTEDESNIYVSPPFGIEKNNEEHTEDEFNIHISPAISFVENNKILTEDESNIYVSPPFSFEENNEKLTQVESNIHSSPPLGFAENVEKLTENESNIYVSTPFSFEESDLEHIDDERSKQVTPSFSYEQNDQERTVDKTKKRVTPPFSFEENGHKQTDDISNKKVTQLYTLTNHNEDLTQEKPHCCNVCQKRFMLRKVLLSHMRKRHWGKIKSNKPKRRRITLCCEICHTYFALKKPFLAHMQQHTEVESNIQVSQPFSLEENNQEHTDDESSKQVSSPISFDKNVQQDRKDESNKQKTPVSNVINHKKKKKFKPHRCDICLLRFVHRKSLHNHLIMRHPKPNESNSTLTNEPNKQLTQAGTITNDNKYSTQKKPHRCNICQKRFLHEKCLLNHVLNRHQIKMKSKKDSTQTQEKPLCRDTCQTRLTYRKSLSNHINHQHHPTQDLKQIQLNESYNMQTNESNEQVTLLSTLTNHNENLTQEKLYCCNICQKSFVLRKVLVNHMEKMHQKKTKTLALFQEKLHACEFCQKRFVLKKVLYNHILKRHRRLMKSKKESQPKFYYCDICKACFTSKKLHLAHTQQHIDDDESNIHVLPPFSLGENELDQEIKDDESNKQVTPPFTFDDSDPENTDGESNNQIVPPSSCEKNIHHTEDKPNKQVTPPFTFDDTDEKKSDGESNNQIVPPSSCEKNIHHTEDKPNKQVTPPFTFDDTDEKKSDGESNNQIVPPSSCEKNDHHTEDKSNKQVTPLFGFDESDEEHIDDESNSKITPPTSFNKNSEDPTEDESNQQVQPPSSFANHDQTCMPDTASLKCPTAGQGTPPEPSIRPDVESPAGSKQTLPNPENLGLSKPKNYSCIICNQRYAYEINLMKHNMKKHCEINEVTSRSKFTSQMQRLKVEIHRCNVCQKRFAYEESLLTHMKQHTEDPTSFTTIQFRQSKNVLLRQ